MNTTSPHTHLTQGIKNLLNTYVQIISPSISNISSVDTTTTLESLMQILIDNKVLSVPVKNGDHYTGFVGVHQVVGFILKMTERQVTKVDYGHQVHTVEMMPTGIHTVKELFSQTVNDILIEYPREFYYVNYLDTLQHAVDILSGKAVSGVAPHRIAVFEGERMVSLLTQSRIVKFLSESLYAFNIGNMSVGDIGLGNPDVISVNQAEFMRDAFQKISELSIQAVAVVDDDGVLVGKISAQDIKYPFEHRNVEFYYFLEDTPISEYLKEETTLHNYQTVLDTQTLDELVDLIVDTSVHRVFIVDEEKKLKGIVSLTDIMNLFSDH
eukprot:TRINITY_DN35_c0_g1_i1.p1 TRINITY_DN35_c0_g1~~TRINITY_DN35_c0_g1_i1.p1  ORF type:complete len:349 (-),score=59.24 TRINITY_DN35_c0_g1_i1:12-986(-)